MTHVLSAAGKRRRSAVDDKVDAIRQLSMPEPDQTTTSALGTQICSKQAVIKHSVTVSFWRLQSNNKN